MAGGVMNEHVIRKIIQEISVKSSNDKAEELIVVYEGTETKILHPNLQVFGYCFRLSKY